MDRFRWIIVAYLGACFAAGLTLLALSEFAPLYRALGADVVATLVVFGFSLGFRNSSFYDAYWSVAPPLLLGYWWWVLGAPIDARVVICALLTAFWAVRLTHNWAKGWRGLSDEDWRYQNLQMQLGLFYWPVSFLGIHLMPTLWVFCGCLGYYIVVQPGAVATPWSWLDTCALAVGVAAVAIETRADWELRRFRQQRTSAAELLQSGVWSWCRHPNYLGELGFWFAIALFATAAAGAQAELWDPALAPAWVWLGPGVMLLLFLGVSIPMLEKKLTAAKPGYSDYAARTFALLPLSHLRQRQ